MSSRITILPFFLSMLFVLCSTSPIHIHEFSPQEDDTQATSGRSVHYGDWVIHREIFVDDGCRSYYGSDYLITATSTLDMLAIYSEGCDDENGDVIVYNTHDLSLLHTIQNSDSLRDVMFSPDGQYLALRSPETFSVVETATWTEVVSQSRSTGDNFFSIQSHGPEIALESLSPQATMAATCMKLQIGTKLRALLLPEYWLLTIPAKKKFGTWAQMDLGTSTSIKTSLSQAKGGY